MDSSWSVAKSNEEAIAVDPEKAHNDAKSIDVRCLNVIIFG